ncbi:hypothetical protein HN588_09160, partial [Candidatus Bathyarchaeota archaeon]|nr:hypothetical protein [Candidatus Bathyarchaeota archaeon]
MPDKIETIITAKDETKAAINSATDNLKKYENAHNNAMKKGAKHRTVTRQLRAQFGQLGYQIQDEIYRMMPPSRLGNTYCKYIPDYVMDMNLTNWRTHLGRYIHGSGVELNENCNKKSRLGSYPSTRYRWINCVNFSSNSGKPTVEFRNHGASM